MRADQSTYAKQAIRHTLGRGQLARLVYRLGRHGASGVLAIATTEPASFARPETFILRRGSAVVAEGELAKRSLLARLTRLAGAAQLVATFEGGVAMSPPGAQPLVSLAGWARTHLEQQLDNARAERLVGELAGVRLSLRPELAPEPTDEADRRMLAAMSQPRRLDQIWPLARTPRFRLLAFLHFLRAVDALEAIGVVAEQSAPVRRVDPARLAAARVLGVESSADSDQVKRAYRRLARALHPDLQPGADSLRKRALELRFAEVTAAYEALV